MDPHPGGDLGVDVLVIGGGIQGLYIARELSRTYSVCVVSDPAVASSTLESDGYLSAGYDGTDVNRIQPARRAAAWWRLWAESNGVPFDHEIPWYVVPPAELSSRTRLWTDATLAATQVDDLPPVFGAGTLSRDIPFRVGTDLVINPATLLAQLRDGIESRCIEGEVVRFGLFTDDVIDDVQVQVGDRLVPIVARFVVLAAGVGNADLLTKLSARFSSQARRKASKELVAGCQAVRVQHRLVLRGRDLPDLSGRFGDLCVVSHRAAGSDDQVWVVSPPIDDSQTILGSANLRFEAPIDPAVVSATVERLLAMSPALEKQADDLRWAVYTTRRTQHPALGGPDPSSVAQPVPAKLEKFGLESFLAVWPSHLAYAQFVGDSVTERIAEALGAPGDFGEGLAPADLGGSVPALVARWDRPDFEWLDWSAFAQAWGVTRR
jgi:glycine/D-amino acid oxidase-like deaminating enzyme